MFCLKEHIVLFIFYKRSWISCPPQVLEMLHLGYEVPFIVTYRPDEYQPHLSRNDIWRIFDIDAKWERLVGRRITLDKFADKLRSMMPEESSDIMPSSSDVLEKRARMEKAQSVQKNSESEMSEAWRVLNLKNKAVDDAQKRLDDAVAARDENIDKLSGEESAARKEAVGEAEAQLQQAQADKAEAKVQQEMAEGAMNEADEELKAATLDFENARDSLQNRDSNETSNGEEDKYFGPIQAELPDDISTIWKAADFVDEEELDDAQIYLRLLQEAVVVMKMKY